MTVNLTRIYTRLGDSGETHLGDMSRVPKTHPRIEAYGTVDELNAQIGLALTIREVPEQFGGWLERVQNDLFDVGADIEQDRKSTRLNSSHRCISYAVFCLKKKNRDDENMEHDAVIITRR